MNQSSASRSILLVVLLILPTALWASIVGTYEIYQVQNRWNENVALPHPTKYDLKVTQCPNATNQDYYCLTFDIFNTFYLTAPRNAGRVNVTDVEYVSSTQKKVTDDNGEATLENRVKSILIRANSPKLVTPRQGRLTLKSRYGRIIYDLKK